MVKKNDDGSEPPDSALLFLPCTKQEASHQLRHRLHHPFEKTEFPDLLCSVPHRLLLLVWVRISLIFGFLDFSFHARRPPPNPPASVCLLQILVLDPSVT
ncbi:hypothetical protein SLEP1_g18948 [Rubroshorea leprosula]|uniref:Uncharacterized protein n=1 Tax=Rubroshorea leprosula TaxID=152421 RepID=A0AAV5IZ61_9ROSI|nr:hypothetical protein SLEP1_g18948 [Rubroshorea leprosula]